MLLATGPNLDGESIFMLMESQQVTMAAGVPTVWLNLLTFMEERQVRLTTLKIVAIGGAAPARSMIEMLEFK